MLDPNIKRAVASADIGEPYTFVLEWRAAPDAEMFAPSSSKRERLQRLIDFYRDLKQPVLDALSRNDHVSVKDLPTSGQIIVTASAGTWRDLLSELERDAAIRVLPNAEFHALQ
jgi:hypothetical protein